MYYLKALTASTLMALASSASASSFLATTDTLGASLANSVELSSDASSSLRDDKRVVEAQSDAVSFVASEGHIRGANLEAALVFLRSQAIAEGRTDMELAQAIAAR